MRPNGIIFRAWLRRAHRQGKLTDEQLAAALANADALLAEVMDAYKGDGSPFLDLLKFLVEHADEIIAILKILLPLFV